MPNYNGNAKSLINGLSDFWTLYFKESHILEELYRGVEIDVGQVYLDLLSLLLNNSTQDTALFNKQYFKLVRLREDTVTYASDGRYGVALSGDLVSLKYLNNRVFGSTATMERDLDFIYDNNARSALFSNDIFSLYLARSFGAGTSQFRVTSRLPRPEANNITVTLADTATHPPTASRADYAVTVNIDSTLTTAADVVSAINLTTNVAAILHAELPEGGTGGGLVSAAAATPLRRQEVAPVQGFAAKTFDVLFGSRFSSPAQGSWLDRGVEKGDVLRIIGGPEYGTPQEFPISIVRETSLLLYPQACPADITTGLDYVVLRDAVDPVVTGEPFANTGALTAPYSTGCTITGATRTIEFGAPVFPLTDFFVGETIQLGTALNAGEYRIREVIAVPPSVVVDGNPLVDETGVTLSLRSAITHYSTSAAASLTATDADGLAVFEDLVDAIPANAKGAVLVLEQSGVYYKSEVVRVVSATALEIRAATGLVAGAGLSWALAMPNATPQSLVYAPPYNWVLPGSVSVQARRYIDEQGVISGRDYVVDVDLGTITMRTPWRASETNTVAYIYRDSVTHTATALQSGAAGTLASGATLTFTAGTLATAPELVGGILRITGAATAANNRDYRILSIASATSVVVENLPAVTLPDANNGSLSWAVYARGGVVVDNVIDKVTEIAAWAPDVSIDKYHLYYTYGYLINRVQHSSDAYRALIRGVFQLFMLGPTLERFESAVNVTAGLPVVRDDGEVLLEYNNGASKSGAAGSFDANTRVFTASSPMFGYDDVSAQLFVTTGFNALRSYHIEAVLSPTQLRLVEVPIGDSGVSWELTFTNTHTIRTSRTTYTFPRAAPIKSKYTDPGNAGVLTLRAFEVLSAAFTVTDYVETPTWWESARIPEVLLPSFSAQRRQSTPKLFENVVGAGDDPHVGDLGFYVGADSDGVVPSRAVLDSGNDGERYSDPLFPSSYTQAFFEAASATFTAQDLGNIIKFSGVEHTITNVVSSTRVQITSYLPLPYDGTPLVDWELLVGTLPMRHTAAYMIIDTALKHHLFTVQFDAFLLQALESSVIADLQELVFVAKPTYTYLVLTPSLLFNDVVRVEEDTIDVHAALLPGGQGGEEVRANVNELRVDGSWRIGSWFREIENTDTFVAPVATVADVLGAPAVGYENQVARVYITPGDFTRSGVPVAADLHRIRQITPSIPGLNITVSGGETTFSLPSGAEASNAALMNYLEVMAPAVNAGLYRIGRVVSPTLVVVDAPGAVNEFGVDVRYHVCGSQESLLIITDEGESFLEDSYGGAGFDALDTLLVGSFVRRTYPSATHQQVYRVDERITSTRLRLATQRTLGTYTFSVVADRTVEFAALYVNETYTYEDRRTADMSTAQRKQFYLEILSGPEAGETRRLMRYVDPRTVRVDGFLSTASGITGRLYVREHYAGTPEGGSWEQYVPEVRIDNVDGTLGELTLPTTGVDAGVVNYAAVGVQVPTFPLSVTFDATAGDTYYTVGGLNPILQYTRTRTSRDVDLLDNPVRISRSTVGN